MKQLKEADVVMLPTEKANRHPMVATKWGDGTGGLILAYADNNWCGFQHICFTSDEEIKEGDWYILAGIVYKATKDKIKTFISNKPEVFKKIIATTDKDLILGYESIVRFDRPLYKDIEHLITNVREEFEAVKLPQIPESFIKVYVEANGKIDKVMLEYEPIYWDEIEGPGREGIHSYKLKTREDNTVIVHPVKERTFTVQEMRTIVWEARRFYQDHKNVSFRYLRSPLNRWITETILHS